MLSPRIQLGARVRRRNDNGMDTPGAVVRINDNGVMVYWPDDHYYEIVPVEDLELYHAIPDAVAA